MGVFSKPKKDPEIRFSELCTNCAALVSDLSQFTSNRITAPVGGLADAAGQATAGIAESAKLSAKLLYAMAGEKIGATVQVRQFKDDQNIKNDVQKPNRAVTAAVITFCILIEGLLGAGLFFADGKADLELSLVYGLTIASANIGLGVFNGFVFGRGLGYMIDAREPKLRYLLIRIGCWVAFIGFFAVMLAMHYAASRVQLTGDPNDILSFAEHGPFDSFANYYSILLMIVGIVGGIVAIREGIVGILDQTYFYSAICAQAEAELREAAEESYIRACETLDLQYEDIAGQCDDEIAALEGDLSDYDDTRADLRARIKKHDLDVRACMEASRREAEDAHDRAQKIKGVLFEARPFDVSRFDALIIDIPEDDSHPHDVAERLAALRKARQSLEAAYQQGLAAIEQAYAAFLSGITDYDRRNTTPP